jgi:chromate transporter
MPWMQASFYGVGAAVIGVIARAAYRLARLTLAGDRLLWIIFAVLAITTAWTEREIVWLFLAAGLVPLSLAARSSMTTAAPASFALIPAGLGSVSAAGAAPGPLALLWFFAKAGAFVFGSGLAIVPFLYGGVVRDRGWLSEQEFLDAVAVAMITPGPVVITVAFIGYLVAGWKGLLASAVGVFLPVYLFVIGPAPFFRRHRANAAVKAFVSGVTAAASGAIAGAAVVLARRALVDAWTIAIAILTLIVLTRWKVPEVLAIAAAGLAGLWLRL